MKIYKVLQATIFLILITLTTIFAEQKNTLQDTGQLHIGDKMPDAFLNDLLKTQIGRGRISDITHGRALIIDFFATWCGACIKELPTLQKLQHDHDADLAVLVVSNEKVEILKKFLDKNADVSLPFLANDHELMKLFPHHEIPHEVWIDKSGIIKAITNADPVNEANIAGLVNNQMKDLPVKNDLMDFSTDVPLFLNGNGGDGNTYLARSILTKSLKGADSPLKIILDHSQPGDKIKRIIVVNHPILQLYYMAYSQLQIGGVNYKRIVWNTRDSTLMKDVNKMHDQDEYYKYCYCYEYIPVQSEAWDIIFAEMMEDLNRYFPYKGSIENREVSCWIVKRSEKAGAQHLQNIPDKTHNTDFKKLSLREIVTYLNRFFQMEPIIDETGNSKPDDILFNIHRNYNSYPDMEEIRKDLLPYGLSLVKERRAIPVLVIKDKKQ